MQRGAAQGNGWTYFISHKQSDSATEALELTVQLGKGACWLDVHQRDASEKAMENGVRNSQFFVCILSPGYLESKWCMKELEWAFTFSKPIILCFRAADNVGDLLQRLPSEFASVSNIQGIKLDRSHPDFFQVAVNMIHERVGDATGSSDGISKVRRGKEAIEHWKTMRATVFTVVAARRFREGGKEHHRSNHELDVLPAIALRKLENPQLQLNADQQLEVLEACIAAGKQQAVRATDKQLVMVIGNTGAGKSTLVNYLHGCQMELHKTADAIGKKKKVIRVREDSSPPELMVIGHTNKSATFMPKVDGGDDALTFADCPGFLDNRGAEINIANAVNIKAAVSQAAGIRVLIVLNYYSLKADRGRGIRELAQILADLFGDARRMGEHASSVVLGLSQAPRRDEDDDEPMQLSDFQDRVSDTTGLGDDAAAIVKSLVSRMFVYDPLNRGDETWSVCDQILASLRSLPPIAEPGDVFRTVLTAEDERALRACVSEMSMRLRKGMERKEYDMVGTMLRQLSALEGIGNPLVTRMLAYAREQVALASVMLKDDAIRCAMTRGFDEADEGVRELKRAASALSKAGQATNDLARRVLKMSEDASAAVSRLKEDEQERRQMRDRHDALQRQVEFLEAKAREDRERADAQRAELEKERADNERKRKEMAEAFEAERKKLEERMAESNEAEVRKKMQEELKRLEAERDAQEREAHETFEKRERQLREQAEASARRAAEAEKERQSLMSAAKKEVVATDKEFAELIDDEKWDDVRAFLKSNSQLAKSKHSAFLDRLPLHRAASKGAPVNVIRALIDAYPAAVREKDRTGTLPLHLAAANASIDVVRILLEAYPEGKKIANNKGNQLPYDCAMNKDASAEVIKLLVVDTDKYANADMNTGYPRHGISPNQAIENIETAESIRDVNAVLTAMRQHESHAGVQERACFALNNLSHNSPENVTRIGKAGGIEAVVAAMRRHENNAGVQGEACTALNNLSYNSPENRTRIGKAGGIEAVVAAMRRHENNAGVQERACFALNNLTYNSPENVMRIGKAGGIEAVVAAMRRHENNAGVQEWACRALAILSVNHPENKSRIGQAGGIEAVVAAMRRHESHAGVQERACTALCNLPVKHPENMSRIAQAGGIEALLSAMKRHENHAVVQEYACWVLRNLSSKNDENKSRIGQAGGIEALVEAMKRHEDHAGVQVEACKLLKILCKNNHANDRGRAHNAGAVNAIHMAQRKHPQNSEVQEWAERALEVLGASPASRIQAQQGYGGYPPQQQGYPRQPQPVNQQPVVYYQPVYYQPAPEPPQKRGFFSWLRGDD